MKQRRRKRSGLWHKPSADISFAEAEAFIRWCNEVSAPRPWQWTLPQEDIWEFSARAESGLTYPWGDAFDPAKCNSAETGTGCPTDVAKYGNGVSRLGCYDMAGNVWEFVQAEDAESDWCVVRGGSYKNDRFEVRSYLRLIRVPTLHRPPDFGFRLAQVQEAKMPMDSA